MNEEKNYTVVIEFTDDSPRRHLDASNIQIAEGCLIVFDQVNEIPREVHCFPLASIKSIIFDYVMIKDRNAVLGHH